MIEAIDDLNEVPDRATLRRLVQSLQPANVRDTLRRCAVAHSFDRSLYDAVLAAGVEDAPPFDDAIRWREVILSGTGRYAVRDRQTVLHGWNDPAEIAALRHAIAAHCDPANRDEVLYQTLTCDPPRGRQLLADAFAAADQKFQLGRCSELLSLAIERHDVLDADTKSLIDNLRALLRARSFWKNEYYKSLVYLSRPTVEPFFETLLEEVPPKAVAEPLVGKQDEEAEQPWVGNLFAMGGRGKTAAIRWLIARTCVPRRIPVAKIDFDFPPDGAPQPAAFLLEIVRQLDEQIPGSVYFELIKDLAEYVGSGTGGTSFADPYLIDQTNRFASTLREVRGPAPTLIIFDTVEEAMLTAGGEMLRGFMELFRGARVEARSIRLLFSGRYSIWEEGRVDGIEWFRDKTISKEIGLFDDDEARRYLLERRKLPDSKALPAIVAASNGLPFKLSLYADIIKDEPEVDVEELVAAGSVELTYLIRRVVRRLPDPRLQWVLRYGVVPRRLTIDFLREVAPYLLEAMLGPNEFDKPLENLPPALREKVFAQGILTKEQSLEVEQLWASLTRYAAEHSWVTAERSDLLRFHPEVLNPMRKLLRDNPIFHTLHERAAEHYDRLGNTRESIYHRFQIGMADAEEYWRDAVDRAIKAGMPEELQALALEVPEEHALRPEAQRREAQALLHIARLRGPSDPAWHAAKRAGERINDAAVAAAVALNAGAADEALSLLEAAQPVKDADFMNVALLRGSAHAALGANELASVAFDEARAFAEFVKVIPEWPWRVIEHLTSFTVAEQHASAGRYDEASAILRRARKADDEQFASEAALRLARLQLQLRMPALALQTLTYASADDVRRAILESEAALLRFDPLRALNLLPHPKGDFVNLARAAQLRARIHARMGEIEESRRASEEALSSWRQAAQRNQRPEVRFGFTACLAEAAAAEIDEFGDLRKASELIAHLYRALTREDHHGRFHASVLETIASTGRGMLRVVEEANTPLLRIVASVVLLRNALGLSDELDLAGALSEITPPQARLPFLEGLRYITAVRKLDKDDRRSIVDLLPDPRSDEEWSWVPKDDRATLALVLMDVHRLFGNKSEATSLLAWAATRLNDVDRPLFDRVRMRAQLSLGLREGPHDRIVDRWRDTLGEHPDFLATLLIQAAAMIKEKRRASELAEEALETVQSDLVREKIKRDAALLGLHAKTIARREARELDAVAPSHEVTIQIDAADAVRTELSNGESFLKGMLSLPQDPNRPGGIVPHFAVKELVGQRAQALDGLRARLFDNRLLLMMPRLRPCDVRLELDRTRQAYPWELAVPEEWKVFFRSLYRTLPRLPVREGSGPLPREPRILVIRRSMRTEIAVQRGSQLPIESVYQNAQVVEDPSSDEIYDALRNSQPDLIHISSSVAESHTTGDVYLEFSSQALAMAASVPQSLSPRLLGSAASSLKKRPIVLLDATLPRGETEAVRQLFLRNAFAADLFATDAFQAVIATGLFEYADAWEGFAREIHQGRRAGDLVRALRNQDLGTSLIGQIATCGIAFFSHSADLTAS